MNIFETATRKKLRFPSVAGNLSVEDLWELPLTSARKANLDDVAKAVNRTIKTTAEESFVTTSTSVNRIANLKLDIIKYIIGVKQSENTAYANQVENNKQAFKIQSIIENKKDSALEGQSVEELERQLASLKG